MKTTGHKFLLPAKCPHSPISTISSQSHLHSIPGLTLLVSGSISLSDNTSLKTIVLGDNSLLSSILFTVTFTSSTLSASLGLARGLLTGVTRCIGPTGYLDGLLSGRFLIAFLAAGLILVVRAFLLSMHILVIIQSKVIVNTFSVLFQLLDTDKMSTSLAALVGLSILYLPQLLLTLLTTLNLNMTSLTILRNHPSILILPVFTFFTMGKPDSVCWSDPKETRVMFCSRATKMNIYLSCACYALYWFFLNNSPLINLDTVVLKDYIDILWVMIHILFILAIALTITFIYFDFFCCCCCAWFLSAKQEIVVFDHKQSDQSLKHKSIIYNVYLNL